MNIVFWTRVKSRQNIADDLDLSKQTVFTIITTLVNKGLIDKNEETGHLKPSDYIREIFETKQNWLLGNSKIGFISAQQNAILDDLSGKETVPMVKHILTDGKESLPIVVKKLDQIGKETVPKNNREEQLRIIKEEGLGILYENFISMRRKIKKPPTEYAEELLLEKLNKISGGDAIIKKQVIEQSIRNSWQDFFELKMQKTAAPAKSKEAGYYENRTDL